MITTACAFQVVQIYNFDPTLAPAGKTLLTLLCPSDYAYWAALQEDPERYEAEKEKIADQVVHLLDRRFLGLAGHAGNLEPSDEQNPART